MEVGQCAGATRDRLDEILASEEVLPSLSSGFGIEDELLSAYEESSQDSLELAKIKEDLKNQELEAKRLEISNVEQKILRAKDELKGHLANLEELKGKIDESKKKLKRKGGITIEEHQEVLGNVQSAKSLITKVDQLRLEFEMWMKRLQTINKRSAALKNHEVIRLVVLFQKMEKQATR